MKRIGMFVLVVLMLTGGVALAGSVEIPKSVTMSAKQFKSYTPKKADVVFNHESHSSVACTDCHHTTPQTMTIQGCMSDGCHDNVATRSEQSSVYLAFHTTKDTTKSCVGCHREMKKQGTGEAPLACNSCHVPASK